jgi:hypothetical protein
MKLYIKPENIEKHYTKSEMVKDLIKLIPYKIDDEILDAGSGLNKVWFNAFDCNKKYECELENGCDFYDWKTKVDWVVGNPPFSHAKDFLLKASEIADKGIAFLVNNQCFNSFLLPSRLQKLLEKGFYINKIKVVNDKRWFGRYYFVIFSKETNNLIEWELKTY